MTTYLVNSAELTMFVGRSSMAGNECTFPETSTFTTGRPPDVSIGASRVELPSAGARRIVRTEYLRRSAAELAQQSAVLDRLYGVYSETAHGTTRDELETLIAGSGEFSLALFHGADDELAGFSYAHIERIEYAGRTHAVFNAAVLCRLGYRGGSSGALFGLREALRFKLRHPRIPLAYFTRTSSPAAYRLIASTMPRVYPSRTHQTPPDVSALMGVISARRHYVPISEERWVVRSPAIPNDASRLRRLERDPFARFYTQLNPHYTEGSSLMTWVPLDTANILGGLLRLLRGRSAR